MTNGRCAILVEVGPSGGRSDGGSKDKGLATDETNVRLFAGTSFGATRPVPVVWWWYHVCRWLHLVFNSTTHTICRALVVFPEWVAEEQAIG